MGWNGPPKCRPENGNHMTLVVLGFLLRILVLITLKPGCRLYRAY